MHVVVQDVAFRAAAGRGVVVQADDLEAQLVEKRGQPVGPVVGPREEEQDLVRATSHRIFGAGGSIEGFGGRRRLGVHGGLVLVHVDRRQVGFRYHGALVRLDRVGRRRRQRLADTTIALWAPRHVAFVKVHLGGAYHLTECRHPNVVGAGRMGGAAQVRADPSARIHVGFAERDPRFHRVGETAKRENRHHLWLLACHSLEGRHFRIGRTS